MIIDESEVSFYYKMPKSEPQIEDLVGEAKRFAEEFLLSLVAKDSFIKAGVHPDKSFLLEGDAGTGKTYSVEALNNTLNKGYNALLNRYVDEWYSHRGDKKAQRKLKKPPLNAYFFPYDIGSYGTAFINRGSRIVEAFFNVAMQYAQKAPSVVVIDEADAVLGKRESLAVHSGEDYKLLETFMKNLQKAHDFPDLYVILMTNFRENIDNAVLRAGRIDKKYQFNLPDEEARKAMFRIQTLKIERNAGYKIFRQPDLELLASESEGFNNADIVNVVEQAVKERVREKFYGNPANKVYVTTNRLLNAIKDYNEQFKEKRLKIGFKA